MSGIKNSTYKSASLVAQSEAGFWFRLRPYRYRLLAGFMLILALALTLLTPHDQRRLGMPEPWSYELAAQHFAQGNWTLTREELAGARTQVRLQGSRLTQYVEIEPGRWAFRQSPGHPLQLALFQLVGQPRLAGAALAVLAVLVAYPVLAVWYDERLAFLGSTLLLWTPISLLALHYSNMDTFAGGIWPLIAGALLLSYERLDRTSRYAPLVLSLAGFAAGWGIVVRITSLPLLLVLVGYGLYLIWAKQPRVRSHRRRAKQHHQVRPDSMSQKHLAAFAGGGLLALGILVIYNWLTFGSPLDSGYLYPSDYEEHNLWSENPLTEVPGGVSTWLAGGTVWDLIITLFVHVRLWLRPATFAWPLWPLALWGLVQLLRQRPIKPSTWFMTLWLLAAYAPYAGVVFFGVTRALAVPYDQGWGYFVPARYLYPLLWPFVWTLVYLLSRWPVRWSYLLVGLYALGSAWLFLATLVH